MPGIKEDREDSDGEEMEHESGESSSTCDSSDIASDSDDSSEMDEEECDRRRNECLENIEDLETQFTLIREQLYRERSTQIDYKLDEVRSGRAVEYLQPLEELKENMIIRTEVASVLRDLRLRNIKNSYEAEQLSAEQNLESEKCLLWDSIQDDLEDKIRHLEEDRNNVDINADFLLIQQSFSSKSIKRGTTGKVDSNRRKQITVSGPYIVYMLNDSDILEDWTCIKKAITVCKRKAELSRRDKRY